MAVSSYLYASAAQFIWDRSKDIDWDTDTIKVTLHTSSYTPDQDSHQDYADLTNELASGNGYTSGGETLATKTVTLTNNVLKLDAADTTWTSSTITARYAVVRDASDGTAANEPLIGYVDFGEDKSTTNSTFKITWSSSGIVQATVADA